MKELRVREAVLDETITKDSFPKEQFQAWTTFLRNSYGDSVARFYVADDESLLDVPFPLLEKAVSLYDIVLAGKIRALYDAAKAIRDHIDSTRDE